MVKKACTLIAAIFVICLGATICTGYDFEGEPLYKGEPLLRFLGRPIADVVKVFGQPTMDDWYEGVQCYGYNDNEIIFYFGGYTSESGTKLSDKTHYVAAAPRTLEIDGKNLNMNRAELVKTFSYPYKEEGFFNAMDEVYQFIITYNGTNFTMRFHMDPPEEKVRYIEIFPKQDDE